MKLSRRCFLSFSIGGAAGTALTPLPWKIADDLSIWSQNWPWTPVPADGAYQYVDTTCTLCPGHCGIRVRKVDGRAVKIESREAAAMNAHGGICLLGLSGLQLLYGPTRIPGPMKRNGQRGQGNFAPVTWREAIEDLTAKLADIREQGKPQSLACLAPEGDGTVSRLMQRFAAAYGTPNLMTMPSMADGYRAALRLTQGIDGHVGLDVENCDLLLSFGSALLEGYGSAPRMMRAVNRIKAQHGKLLQVEPRLSKTAAKADLWLAAKPGTEADLALAMAHVIITRQRYDEGFAADHIEGFADFAAMVRRGYAPKAVAKTTGVDARKIVEAALAFSDAKRPLAVWGRGKGQMAGSLKEVLAVNSLNALMGRINRPGGMLGIPAYDYIRWPEAGRDGIAAAGLQSGRADGGGTPRYPHAGQLVHRFIDRVQAGKSQIQALLVGECNPCYHLAHTEQVKAAMDAIPYIVSFSSFWDETALQADLVLPSHLYLERYEDIPLTTGASRPLVGLCRPVVDPLLDTQHPGDTLIQIAHGLKGSVAEAFPWTGYTDCLKQSLSGHWAKMIAKGAWMADNAPVADWDRAFNTPTGKLVLMNAELAQVYRAKAAAPQGDAERYPLQLIPYDTIRLSSRYGGSPPFMVKTVSDRVLKGQDGFVQINPDTAGRLGFAEGDRALLATPLGQAPVRIHLDAGTMPDVVAMPNGLGHTTDDPFLAGKGVNPNRLIGTVEDPASGMNMAWGIRAKLIRA
ncbi:MAG: molybdopterin-dependent oxidoreductase [Desulfatitalea sp.]|nr:molybdopterin-dependent oxidoreductase [Desulfatitalea sp.]NNJ98786.1 molybdopterin-dependent oxidoreductase [Desulfatitalea sp.]